jgi:uncharacterized protein (TIGR03437 family)
MISARLFKRLTFPFFLLTLLFAAALIASPLGERRAFAQSSTPGIKTDRKVYPKPALPALPRAGGTFIDPTFGTQIMRATDQSDCPAPGCGTFYSHWPTFNSDNSFILIRKGEDGSALIKSFDPATFTLGTSAHTPSGIYVPGSGTVSINFQSAIWHPTNPQLLYCFPSYYDGGMKLFTYNVVTRQYTLVKDFGSLGGPQDFLWQMSMSADGDVFAWSQMQAGARSGDPVAYIVWRKSTDTVLYHVETVPNLVNEVRLDKSGKYLVVPYNGNQADGKRYEVLNLATGVRDYGYWNAVDSPTGHGDFGSGMVAGVDHWASGINKHQFSNIHQTQVVFRFQDLNGVTDWTFDLHGTMLAADESWLTVGTFHDPSITGLPDTGVFKDEIMQVKLDGSGEFRRLCHTRTVYDEGSATSGYWATPKPTISKDGRFIAYTSNWEKSGRYDLFILKIVPPGAPTGQPPVSPGLVSAAYTTALMLGGSASATQAQIHQLVTSIEQTYSAFSSEASRFSSASQIETGLRAALYFSRAAEALAAEGPSTGVQNRLQIVALYLAQVQSLMPAGGSSGTVEGDTAHALSSGTFTIGPADTRSNASFAPLVTPRSIGVILGDPNQSPLATETSNATMTAGGQLPFELSGASVSIGGRSAQLLSVSPSRITFYVPAGLPAGDAEVIVTTQDGYVSRGMASITALAPALFTESGDGVGAGVALNASTYTRGSFDVVTPFNLTTDKRTRLMLYATGLSNGAANTSTANDVRVDGVTLPNLAESVTVEARTQDGRTRLLPVEYAGVQGKLPGLDQVNIVLLPELRGMGDVELTVIAGNQRSNKVTVNIR